MSDSPEYLQLLPDCLKNLYPAYTTYQKAVDRTLIDRARRSGRSPSDLVNEINELAHLKYERTHLQ